jgi:hypothetical protein
MPELRRLNELGVSKFADFLREIKETGKAPKVPTEFLTDAKTSDSLAVEVGVERRVFPNRMAAGEYFCNLFCEDGASQLARDPGTWAWLSLFHFDQLCKRKGDGTLDPGELARWIPLESSRRYYRHLLAGPYLIYRAYRKIPGSARIVLCQPINAPGEFVGQLASRQEFVRNTAVIEAATLLYLDDKAGSPKRGTSPTQHRPGTLRRFVDVINQFDLTWDLYSMSGEGLVRILPPEFNHYKPPHLRWGH